MKNTLTLDNHTDGVTPNWEWVATIDERALAYARSIKPGTVFMGVMHEANKLKSETERRVFMTLAYLYVDQLNIYLDRDNVVTKVTAR